MKKFTESDPQHEITDLKQEIMGLRTHALVTATYLVVNELNGSGSATFLHMIYIRIQQLRIRIRKTYS